MAKTFESKAFRAVAGSESLKTTVPQSVATVLGLEAGDTLVWELDVEGRIAVVRSASRSPPTPSKTGSRQGARSG